VHRRSLRGRLRRETQNETHAMRLLLTLALVALCSCQNTFLDFYQGSRRTPVKTPILVSSQPPDTFLLGTSRFQSADRESEDDLLAAAEEVGAEFVSWQQEFRGTTRSSGVIPITTPTTSTTNFRGSVYGYTGGSAMYSGTATTYGSRTTYLPYDVAHHWVGHLAQFYCSNR
jgi:hypothetical protein